MDYWPYWLWSADVLEWNLLAVVHGAWRNRWKSKLTASQDHLSKLWKGDSHSRVKLENMAKDAVELIRHG